MIEPSVGRLDIEPLIEQLACQINLIYQQTLRRESVLIVKSPSAAGDLVEAQSHHRPHSDQPPFERKAVPRAQRLQEREGRHQPRAHEA